MKTFRCRLITHEGVVFDKEVVSLSLPSSKGRLGLLPNRLPIMAALKKSGGVLKIVTIENDEEIQYFFVVRGGSLTHKRNETIILSDSFTDVPTYEAGLELLVK